MSTPYSPISNDKAASDDDFLLEESSQGPLAGQFRRSRQGPSWCLVFLLCAAVSLISALLAVVGVERWRDHSSASFCTGVVAHKSAVTSDIDIKYHTVKFDGSFLSENIYRQQGSPEVDAAWEALGVDYRPVAIPEDRAAISGIAPDQVKIADKYGGGYPANVEGLHHLHCLNLVRKGLWFNYDYYHSMGEGAFLNNDLVVRKHVTHCLDIIRQQLMCTVDIGVLGQVWWKNDTMEHAEAFVDFNTEHVCRNYDDIRKWAEERQLPEQAPGDFLEPPKDGDNVLDTIP